MKVNLIIILALSLNLVACGDSDKGSGRKPAAPEAVKQSTPCDRSEAKYIRLAEHNFFYLTIWDTGRFEIFEADVDQYYNTIGYKRTTGFVWEVKEENFIRSYQLVGFGEVYISGIVGRYVGRTTKDVVFEDKDIKLTKELTVVEEGMNTIEGENRNFHCNKGEGRSW